MKTYAGCQRLFMRCFRFRSSLISDPRLFSLLRRSFPRPAADTWRKLLVAREKKPLVPRVVKTIKSHILFVFIISFVLRKRAVPIFFLPVEQNARDTQMTTRVSKGARRETREALYAHARVHPLEKNRDCTQYISC